jgi:hypothetical protein
VELTIFENYLVSRPNHVAKDEGANQLNNIYYPTHTSWIESLALDVTCDTKPRRFKVTRGWTHQFMKHYMNWTLRATITCTSKFPVDM